MSQSVQAAGTRIVRNPAIRRGEPIIEGTATTVRAVAEFWNRGMPAEEIPIHLPHLELADVFDALHYYLRNRDEIDGYIQANRVPPHWSGKRFNPETRRPESIG